MLFVCTANVCRSPAAEHLAREIVGEQDFIFRSAGFLYDGQPITERMVDALLREGVTDSDLHISHRVEDETLGAADLIFTMEARHLRDLSIRDRSIFQKTVPLMEAAERLDRPMTWREFLASMQDREPSMYFDDRWDVPDPYKRGQRHYREAVDSIGSLVSTVFSNLKT